MKSLAVKRADRRIEQAARLGSNHRHCASHERPLAHSVHLSASQASAENDAKDSIGDSYAIPWGFLNRIFTIRPTTSRWSLLAPSCRGVNRANTRPGPTVTLSLLECASHAGLSLSEPGARMVEDGSCEG
jgi:hypothetical protein